MEGKIEAVKGLRLPSCYVEVTDNEMEYLDGSGWKEWLLWGGLVVAVTGLIASGVGMLAAFQIITLSVLAGKVLAVVGFIASVLGVGSAVTGFFM